MTSRLGSEILVSDEMLSILYIRETGEVMPKKISTQIYHIVRVPLISNMLRCGSSVTLSS
jgi:hypothetical protein